MQVSLLGTLAVRDDAGAPIELAGTRLRLLVARLALDAGHPVAADALIDAVWGATPPAGALNALQKLVSRLRRVDVIPALPKTRSGKILRRTMRGIADGRDEPVPSTIDDASVLDALRPVLKGA